jgi:hypothetical protein
MSVPYATPTSVIGRLLDAPHTRDAGGGAAAAFLIQVEQRFKPRDDSASRYRVVCATRWTELVERYLRQGSPVFVDGDAIADSCRGCASIQPPLLLAGEVIPLGRFPNPAFQRRRMSLISRPSSQHLSLRRWRGRLILFLPRVIASQQLVVVASSTPPRVRCLRVLRPVSPPLPPTAPSSRPLPAA